MTRPHKIHIAGFPDAELSTLTTFFRIAVRSQPGFEVVPLPQQADIILADGGDTPLLRHLKGMRLDAQVLLIGANDEFPNLAFENRPVRMAEVLRAVEFLLGTYTGTAGDGGGMHDYAAPTEPMPLRVAKDAPGVGDKSPKAFAVTQPWAASDQKAPAAYAATEPMGLEEPNRAAFALTQPLGAAQLNLIQPAWAKDQPWAGDGGINEDELEAFRAARVVVAPPAPSVPVPVANEALPVADQPAPSAVNHASAAPAPKSPGPVRGPRALLVDSTDVGGRRIERLLGKMGYITVRARSTDDALKLAAKGQFALAIVDTQVPHGGYSHCRAVGQRLRVNSPAVALLALGRSGGVIERLRAKFAGCSACVARPIDLVKLELLIEAMEPEPPQIDYRKSA